MNEPLDGHIHGEPASSQFAAKIIHQNVWDLAVRKERFIDYDILLNLRWDFGIIE
jgi:hypothetical protein